jgi:hypothetical protein
MEGSLRFDNFILIGQKTWPPKAILYSGWSISKNLLLSNHLAK